MGQISLSIPVVGQPNATQDPLIASDFTTIQTVINGNIDDTNLYAPNNAVRRLLLSSSGFMTGLATGVYYFTPTGPVQVGANSGYAPDMWWGDAGVNGQPKDFQVSNKTAYGRIRAVALTNTVAPGQSFGVGLYPITAVAGPSSLISFTGSTPVGGSTVNFGSQSASTIQAIETPQFALPQSGAPHFLAAFMNGNANSGSVICLTIQLYGYNA